MFLFSAKRRVLLKTYFGEKKYKKIEIKLSPKDLSSDAESFTFTLRFSVRFWFLSSSRAFWFNDLNACIAIHSVFFRFSSSNLRIGMLNSLLERSYVCFSNTLLRSTFLNCFSSFDAHSQVRVLLVPSAPTSHFVPYQLSGNSCYAILGLRIIFFFLLT